MKQRKRYVGLQRKKAKAGILFIMPFILGFLLFMVKPLAQSFYMSFCNVELSAGNYNPIWAGIANYIHAFRVDPEYNRLLTEEIVRMMLYSVAIIVFSFFVSLILNQEFHGRALVRAIFFLPVILSSGVIIGLESNNQLMANLANTIEQTTQGISITAVLENILRTSGVGTRAFEKLFEIIDNIYDVAIASGIPIIIFLSGLQSIPSNMYEAADIEGCTKSVEDYISDDQPALPGLLDLHGRGFLHAFRQRGHRKDPEGHDRADELRTGFRHELGLFPPDPGFHRDHVRGYIERSLLL